MNKYLFFLFIVINSFASSQICGFEEAMNILENQDPETKQYRKENSTFEIDAISQRYVRSLKEDHVYEIPIVVHVIESQKNTNRNVTDQEIINWIELTNRIYATTAGNKFFPKGEGPEGGTVIPFRLVLAKRSPNCEETTGIVRYNGSSLSGYDDNGLRQRNPSGTPMNKIQTLAPHWPEHSYFNIYIVISIDGYMDYNAGIAGYAHFPDVKNSYHAVIKSAVVKQLNNTVLAHEFGHALGLLHPWGGNNDGKTCPKNNDCTKDNDKICDTSPTQSLIHKRLTPTSINPCTGELYDGIEYNIMGYTPYPKKFTPGQRDRALAIFLKHRKVLTQSLAGIPLPSIKNILKAPKCTPSINPKNISNNKAMEPILVKFNTIENSTAAYFKKERHYNDYSSNCLIASRTTIDIANIDPYQLEITVQKRYQYVKAWIDYNNNGTFENEEIIADSSNFIPTLENNKNFFITTIKPLATAVLDTPLRMRVIADRAPITDDSCNLELGQAEDYMVTITNSGTLSTDTIPVKSEIEEIIYDEKNNSLKTLNKNFGNYSIHDSSGRLVQKGKEVSDTIYLQFNTKGIYIILFEKDSMIVSGKFLLK